MLQENRLTIDLQHGHAIMWSCIRIVANADALLEAGLHDLRLPDILVVLRGAREEFVAEHEPVLAAKEMISL